MNILKKNKMVRNKSAFSALELVMALLITATILATVVAGGKRIAKMAGCVTSTLSFNNVNNNIKLRSSDVTDADIAALTTNKTSAYQDCINLVNLASTIISTSIVSYDASNAAGFTSGEGVTNGTFISTWVNLTGSGNAFQATEINQPKYTTNCINGLACLHFDHIADNNSGNDYMKSIITHIGGNSLTYFVVAKAIDWHDNGAIFSVTNSGSGNAYNIVGGFNGFYSNGSGSLAIQRVTYLSTVVFPALNTPVLLGGVFDGTNNTNYKNGVASSPSASTGNFNIDDLYLGAAMNGSPQRSDYTYNGYIAEFLMFNTALGSEDRIIVENHLKAKWGIS